MIRQLLVCLLIAGVWQCALSHHLRHHNSNGNNNAGEPRALPPEAAAGDEPGSAKSRRSLQAGFYYRNGSEAARDRIPYSYKKLDKMMNKAILQIILGDLHPADMLLLKALNYTLEDVMTIREHELSRLKEDEALQAREKKQRERELLSVKYQAAMHRRFSGHQHRKPPGSGASGEQRQPELEAYNRQAVYDYENGLPVAVSLAAAGLPAPGDDGRDARPSAAAEETLRQKIDRAMQSHVVFKVRHDDSEFDSGSDEARKILRSHRTKSIFKLASPAAASSSAQALGADASGALDESYDAARPGNFEEFNRQAVADYENLVPSSRSASADESTTRRDSASREDAAEQPVDASGLLEERNETEPAMRGVEEALASTTESSSEKKRVSEYEGLEWVGGDIYRVKPEAMEALLNYEDEVQAENNEEDEEDSLRQSSYSSTLDDLVNDTFEYQNDADESATGNVTDMQANLTSYQRLALAQRRDQGQKAIEDIKLRVLAMTGRFNLTSNTNQVQQRLTMFRPTCQVPRNTDPEAWSDPYSMNMHFQLNLTSGEHVLAAKLRLFKLPQDIVASPTSGSSSSTYEEEEDEDEKKIRISVYFYTKSLKKHRVKKRLMDSVVTPLTSQGSHLALDVRQGLRFWRPGGSGGASSGQQQQQGQQSHGGHANGGNHGLVVQVEDQDGRPLKPSLYIQEPSCQTVSGTAATVGADVVDEKAYQFVPAIFVRACTRYVRLVNGKVEMYVQCRPSQRH